MGQIIIKAAISVAIIFMATGMARRFPSLAGLIGVMPITSVLVLVWVYIENRGDSSVMQGLVKGSLFGLGPAVLFFVVALLCFRKDLPLPMVLSCSFAAWLIGAFVHQALFK